MFSLIDQDKKSIRNYCTRAPDRRHDRSRVGGGGPDTVPSSKRHFVQLIYELTYNAISYIRPFPMRFDF